MDTEDLLSVKDAAAESGYKVNTIYKAIKKGLLVSVVVLGHPAIHREALAAYIAQKGKRRPGAGRPKTRDTSQASSDALRTGSDSERRKEG